MLPLFSPVLTAMPAMPTMMAVTKRGEHLNRAQMFRSARLPLSGPRLHRAVIRVYDAAGNVIETREHVADFREP